MIWDSVKFGLDFFAVIGATVVFLAVCLVVSEAVSFFSRVWQEVILQEYEENKRNKEIGRE